METRNASSLPLFVVTRLFTSGPRAGTEVKTEAFTCHLEVGQVVEPCKYGDGYIVTAIEKINGNYGE